MDNFFKIWNSVIWMNLYRFAQILICKQSQIDFCSFSVAYMRGNILNIDFSGSNIFSYIIWPKVCGRMTLTFVCFLNNLCCYKHDDFAVYSGFLNSAARALVRSDEEIPKVFSGVGDHSHCSIPAFVHTLFSFNVHNVTVRLSLCPSSGHKRSAGHLIDAQ